MNLSYNRNNYLSTSRKKFTTQSRTSPTPKIDKKKKRKKDTKLRRVIIPQSPKKEGREREKKIKQRKIETWTIPFPDNDPTSI